TSLHARSVVDVLKGRTVRRSDLAARDGAVCDLRRRGRGSRELRVCYRGVGQMPVLHAGARVHVLAGSPVPGGELPARRSVVGELRRRDGAVLNVAGLDPGADVGVWAARAVGLAYLGAQDLVRTRDGARDGTIRLIDVRHDVARDRHLRE